MNTHAGGQRDPLEAQGLTVVKTIIDRIPFNGFTKAEVAGICNKELLSSIYGSTHLPMVNTCIHKVNEYVDQIAKFNVQVTYIASQVNKGGITRDQIKNMCSREIPNVGDLFSQRYKDGLLNQCMSSAERSQVAQNDDSQKRIQEAKKVMLELLDSTVNAGADVLSSTAKICTKASESLANSPFFNDFIESCKGYVHGQITKGLTVTVTEYDIPLVNTCHIRLSVMLRNEGTGQLMPLGPDNVTMVALSPYETKWARLKMTSKTRFSVFVSSTDVKDNPGDDSAAAILATPENCVSSRVLNHDPVVSYLIEKGDEYRAFISGLSMVASTGMTGEKAYTRSIGFPLTSQGLKRCQDMLSRSAIRMYADNCEKSGNRYYPTCAEKYKGVGALCIRK